MHNRYTEKKRAAEIEEEQRKLALQEGRRRSLREAVGNKDWRTQLEAHIQDIRNCEEAVSSFLKKLEAPFARHGFDSESDAVVALRTKLPTSHRHPNSLNSVAEEGGSDDSEDDGDGDHDEDDSSNEGDEGGGAHGGDAGTSKPSKVFSSAKVIVDLVIRRMDPMRTLLKRIAIAHVSHMRAAEADPMHSDS